MANITFASIRRAMGLLIPFSLLILFITGCGPSLQEIRAKESLERASSAYSKARANPNVETYAKTQLAEAGRMIQAARESLSFKNMEQLSYLAEKKTQTAVTISEGKVTEKEIETLKREEADVLMQKRLLETQLAQKEAEKSKLEAEKARKEATARAQETEKARAEAEAKAREAEQSKREAEKSRMEAAAKAQESEKARAEAEAKAREAEQSRMESKAEAQKAEQARMEAEAKAREAEQSKAEVEQFLKDLAELQAKQTERGIVLTLGDVLFAFGKADVSAGAVRNVDKLASFLEKHPERKVLIEGHTDSVGSDEFNLTLSQKRADAVKEVLTAKGVSPERILTKGYGKQFPVAGNDTDAGRQMNRRVEVVILNEGVNPEAVLR